MPASDGLPAATSGFCAPFNCRGPVARAACPEHCDLHLIQLMNESNRYVLHDGAGNTGLSGNNLALLLDYVGSTGKNGLWRLVVIDLDCLQNQGRWLTDHTGI